MKGRARAGLPFIGAEEILQEPAILFDFPASGNYTFFPVELQSDAHRMLYRILHVARNTLIPKSLPMNQACAWNGI
jgi:hypothetical protein